MYAIRSYYVALARDVADHLETVGQAHLGDLAQRRVRLLGRGGVHARADAAFVITSYSIHYTKLYELLWHQASLA